MADMKRKGTEEIVQVDPDYSSLKDESKKVARRVIERSRKRQELCRKALEEEKRLCLQKKQRISRS